MKRRKFITGSAALIGYAALPKEPKAGMLINPYSVAPGTAAEIAVDSADFDGTNDYMSRGLPTGIADGKQGTFSCWFRIDGGDAAIMKILSASNGAPLAVERGSDDKFNIRAANSASTTILSIFTVATHTTSATWKHLLSSWDLGTVGARFLYISDVADLSVTTFTDDTIDYADAAIFWGIGAREATSHKFNGCLAELFFHTTYLDISVEANRRKFISAAGKPVNLGANGSTPLGVQPLIYQRIADGGAATDFATNLGTGGDFTITGTLDLCSSNPSD